MLKKIVIGVAVLLLLVLGAGGVYAYRLYTAAQSLVTVTVGNKCVTPKSYRPELLPGNAFQQTAATLAGTTTTLNGNTATPLATPTAVAGATKKICTNIQSFPSLSGKKRINILVLGTDNDSKKIGLLSQTVMVVTIDRVHNKVGLLSIPRDSWLYVPGISVYGDPTTYHKMDEAMSYGAQAAGSTNTQKEFISGVQYAKLTIKANFGISINNYVWVGLQGFVRVIDTLGGVCLNSMHPIVDDNYPNDSGGGNAYSYTRVYIPAGPQCMNGATTLQYVRSRHADLIGDYGRGARQEQLLVALRPKIESLGLTDIFTIRNLVSELQGYVKSDLGLSQALALENFARGIKLSQIHRLVLTPPEYSSTGVSPVGSPAVQDVVYLNWNKVIPAVHRMFASVRGTASKPKVPPVRRVITPVIALRLLLRSAGATSANATKIQAPVKSTQPIKGSIYFVDNGNVWSYSAAGVRRVTDTTAIDGADITPNGHKLVYYRRWAATVSDVWLQNRATGRSKQITHNRSTDGYVQDNLWAVNPVISSDGKTIIYSSDAYKLTTPSLTVNPDCPNGTSPSEAGNGGIDPALYTYNVATGTASQLTAPCWGAGGDTDPRFDPADPNRLVYTEFYYLLNSSVASRLVSLNLTTGTREPITPLRGRNMQATWSPNGRHIAWLGSSDQSTTLYEADFSNGSLHPKTARVIDSGMIAEPVFSPDGKHMAYFKLSGNTFQILERNLKGGWPVGRPMVLMSKADITATSPLVWIK